MTPTHIIWEAMLCKLYNCNKGTLMLLTGLIEASNLIPEAVIQKVWDMGLEPNSETILDAVNKLKSKTA
jgi:hypothetical protein